MTASVTLGTQAIGAAGELLVQYQLLKHGIDSARLTTDSGIDLVMNVPGHQTAATVQVKTKLQSVLGGGKGKLLLSWPFPDGSKAQWLAFVDLSTDSVWLLPRVDTGISCPLAVRKMSAAQNVANAFAHTPLDAPRCRLWWPY